MSVGLSARDFIKQVAACQNHGPIPYDVGIDIAYFETKYSEAAAPLLEHIAKLPRYWSYVGYDRPTGWQPPLEREDEWGVRWVEGMLWPDYHPLQAGYHLFADYPFPDANAPGRFDTPREHVTALHDQGKYVIGEQVSGSGCQVSENCHQPSAVREKTERTISCYRFSEPDG
jgi:hypothetical protein